MARAASSAENSTDNSTKTVPGRPFEKGQSGNPGGRPKGLARQVREIIGDDGEVLARFWAGVMSGRVLDPAKSTEGKPVYIDVDVKDRIVASRLLAERGWGKPPQFAPMDGVDPLELSDRETDELAAALDASMDELGEKRRKKSARAA